MKNISIIPVLFVSFTLLMSVQMTINKIKPHTGQHRQSQFENFKWLNYFHVASIMIMLLPVFITGYSPFFLLLFPDKINIGQAMAFLACFGVIGFFPWKKFSTEHKQEDTILPFSFILLYGLLRFAFLITYEWFFRGFLLTGFSLWLGIGWAIIINTSLYTLIHIHKTKKEIIGCIPFGLLMCVFTVWWQSIWPAIIFHMQLAIIHEWSGLQNLTSPQKQTAL
jgi:membrane protease YdiL (CAAX protease family)